MSKTMEKASFFRKPLPEHLISFTSVEGRKVFREAMAGEFMESYFPLAQQYATQQEPAFCGLTSLMICLNALAIDPQRNWKGPWRFFAEELLDCCAPIDVVKMEGIILTEFACLARCNGAAVHMHRADQCSIEEFRNALKLATSRPHLQEGEVDDDDEKGPLMVVSYARPALGQTGTGHFSPIGGYNAKRDLVLVMDTARFKYHSHWVPVDLMWQSMTHIDPTTNISRGFFLLSRLTDEEQERRLAFQLKKDLFLSISEVPFLSRSHIIHFFFATFPQIFRASLPLPSNDSSCIVDLLIANLPAEIVSIPLSSGKDESSSSCGSKTKKCGSSCGQASVSSSELPEEKEKDCQSHVTDACYESCVRDIKRHLKNTLVFKLVEKNWPPKHWPNEARETENALEIVSLILLSYPPGLYLPADVDRALKTVALDLHDLHQLPLQVQSEVTYIREQLFSDS